MTGKFIISIFDSIPLWVMILPILVCSIIALAVALERTLYYRKMRIDYRLLASSVSEKLKGGSQEEADKLLESYEGSLAVMMRNITGNWSTSPNREAMVLDEAERSQRSVERFGGIISTIATVSPMLGLLGTVTGMMKSFSSLATFGPSAQDLLAQGITEALITTALGLMVAIPSIMFYNFMVSRSETYTREIEFIANSFIDIEEA